MNFLRKATKAAVQLAHVVSDKGSETTGLHPDSSSSHTRSTAQSKVVTETYESNTHKAHASQVDSVSYSFEEWKNYYFIHCKGMCETCVYYDACPDDEELLQKLDNERKDLDLEIVAAREFYEQGCDGVCEQCVHYVFCPADYIEESTIASNDMNHNHVSEAQKDSGIAGLSQEDMDMLAREGASLAKESVLAARELKEAFGDIAESFSVGKLFK